MSNLLPSSAPFDAVAREYDAVFTNTPLGRRQREIVHRYLQQIVKPGIRVLELNCGTGEDAIWLAKAGAEVTATDISGEMLEVASAKAHRAGVSSHIRFRQMSIEEILVPQTFSGERFDLVFSDFDGLNCLADLSPLPEALTRLLRSNGEALLVFMNPVCAMEVLYMLARGRWRDALQRMRRDGLQVHIGAEIVLRTYFHPIGRVVKTFGSRFVLQRIEAVGLTTPPTLMRTFYHRHEHWFRALFGIEDALSAIPPFNRMGDHVMLHWRLRESAGE